MNAHTNIIVIEGNSTLSIHANLDSEQIAADCVRLLKELPTLVSSPGLSDALIHHVFWHYTQKSFVFSSRSRIKRNGRSLGDKYACQFYSLQAWRSLQLASCKSAVGRLPLTHEHVFERSHLLEMLKAGCDVERDLLPRLIGCVVTRDEHNLLNAVPHDVRGWDRYVKAGIPSVMQGNTATGAFTEVATVTLHSQSKR